MKNKKELTKLKAKRLNLFHGISFNSNSEPFNHGELKLSPAGTPPPLPAIARVPDTSIAICLMCAQNNVKWTLDARNVACKYLCIAISSGGETKKRSKPMIPLTLIKTDCLIAVAFDHSSSLMGKNVRIISTKETRGEKALRAAWKQS